MAKRAKSTQLCPAEASGVDTDGAHEELERLKALAAAAVAALAESEARYHALADNTTDVVVRADLQGALLYVSPSCRAWGYQPQELIGRQGAELVHPDDLARFSANTAEVFSGAPIDRSVDREIRYRRKDGAWVWLQGNPQLIRDRDGHPAELLNVLRDVTERRRLRGFEAEQARFERLANEVAGVGYWRLDVKSGKIEWSRQMFLVFGLPPGAEPSLETAMAMFHPDDQALSNERVRVALETGRGWTDGISRLRRPDGELRYVEGRGICEHDASGAVSAVIGTMVDVTDRQRAEIAAAEADAEKRANVELFENGFQHAAIGMALVGLDGRFMKINPAFCAIVGYRERRLLRLDFQTITHPDDLDTDLDLLAQLTAGRIPSYQMDKRYIRADGELVWVKLSVSLVVEPDGRPKHFIAQVLDLTASRAAQAALAESEARYRLLADHAADFIVRVDANETISYVSPSCRLYGYEPSDLIGTSGADIVHPDDLPNLRKIAANLLSGAPEDPLADRDRRVRTKDGSWVWMEGNASVVRDESGAPLALITQLRDVSRRRAMEAELKSARIQAEAAASAKSDFLANMSHELRTPLTSILGFTRLAAEQADLQGLTRTYLERVGDASAALLCTVNDILDFSKLEVGQVSFQREPTALAKLCRATLDLFTPQAGAKDLDLALDCDAETAEVVLMVDPDRIRQLLLNLVGNAVKFTEAGGITLRARYRRSNGRLNVEVIDTGPGIAPDRRDRLFKRFSQVDGSLTRSHGGSGLGLAICKGLAEAMGGEIGADSQLGRGSRFWFAIPAQVADTADAATDIPGVELPTFAGIRVLVVDDHAANRELARLILAGIGAEISEAADGEEAVQLAAEWPFDVILMDLRMPRLDGPGALRRIREAPGPNDATPVLAFTADAGTEAAAHLAALGFEEVVAKPLEPGTLIAAVARATAFELNQQPWDDAALG